MAPTKLAAALTAAVRRLAADGGQPPAPKAGAGVAFKEAIDWHRQRDPLTNEEWRKRQDWYRRRSFTVANVAQLDLVSDVHRAIGKAIEDGTTLEDFKKDVGEKLKTAWAGTVKDPPWRLEVIFRQGTLSAYGAGRYYQASDPAVLKRRPYWGLLVVLDGRTTEKICKPLAGTILPASDPWWRVHIPPLHMFCRTVLATYTEEQAKKKGITAKPSLDPAQEGFGLAPDAIESDGPTGSKWFASKIEKAPRKLGEVAESKQSRAAVGRRAAKPRVDATPDEGGLTPSGTPVSKSVAIPDGKEHEPIRHALRAIDQAHGDGELPPIPARVVPKLAGDMVGEFSGLESAAGKPFVVGQLSVSSLASFQELVAAHEAGHMQDLLSIAGPGRYASKQPNEALGPVFDAIEASASVTQLRKASKSAYGYRTEAGRKRRYDLSRFHPLLRYYLRPEELWARAYAQFVAVRSGDPLLLGQIDAIRSQNDVESWSQWSDDDFKKIKAALDEFFRSKGWLK